MKQRPVYLSLTEFKFPLAAIASILHRITGVVLFAGIAYLLYLLQLGLDSPAGFDEARRLIALPLGKLVLWGVLAMLVYHVVAGVKHLVLDFGVGESLQGGYLGALLTIVVSVVLIAIVGVWLW